MSRVLIVDDDVPLCGLLETVLQEEGYTVSSVHCGESALQYMDCLLYTSPSPRDRQKSRMPSSA